MTDLSSVFWEKVIRQLAQTFAPEFVETAN
jgi:hypothetical protein